MNAVSKERGNNSKMKRRNWVDSCPAISCLNLVSLCVCVSVYAHTHVCDVHASMKNIFRLPLFSYGEQYMDVNKLEFE